MVNRELEDILQQYEQKRRFAQVSLENRKKELYKKIPRLEEIENEINKISIKKTKSILMNENSDEKIQIFDIIFFILCLQAFSSNLGLSST